MIVTHYLAKIWLKLNMVENADIPRPCEANQEENEWSRDINIGDDVAFDQPVGLTIQLQDRPWTILYYILSKLIGI